MKNRTKYLLSIILSLVCALSFGNVFAQSESVSPTQTPYIIYVLVTSTPEPETNVSNTSSSDSTGSVCSIQQSDGSSCTMGFDVVSEPSYTPGMAVGQGETTIKEWVIKNIGTCTWNKDYKFSFDSGLQFGITDSALTEEVAPGEETTISIWFTLTQPIGKIYNTSYAFTSPNGDKCGTISASYKVARSGYFRKPETGFTGQDPTTRKPGEPDPYYCTESGCYNNPGYQPWE